MHTHIEESLLETGGIGDDTFIPRVQEMEDIDLSVCEDDEESLGEDMKKVVKHSEKWKEKVVDLPPLGMVAKNGKGIICCKVGRRRVHLVEQFEMLCGSGLGDWSSHKTSKPCCIGGKQGLLFAVIEIVSI